MASSLLAALGFTLSATLGQSSRGPSPSVGDSSSAKPATVSSNAFSIRPVLCYAPPLTSGSGQASSTRPLPTCAPSSELTATNLGVKPDPSSANGFTSNSSVVRADPQFSGYPSTPLANDNPNDTVLLPAQSSQQGNIRFVLGPAAITRSAVKSASAHLVNNQWTINITLTGEGSTQWDALAQSQFHAIIGIDIGGKVVSAPIVQPSQTSFSSFDGQMQISGSFNQKQAEALAASL
ncbi:MAG TPA: hypothetical protein VHU85_02900 [Acidimicrobiales bacterium]|nr:hypothetical protein [Acidimicrobiales bacterium]